MAVKLHFRRKGNGPPVLLLHGLFGSGANLGALARALQHDFSVYSLDLPNHGASAWLEDTSLAGMAACLADFSGHQSLPAAHIVGHSLGGKLAMQLALTRPELVRSLVVADIAPVAYPPHHDEVFAALEAVAAARCESREAAAEIMAHELEEEQVVQFLLTSLRRDSDGIFRWRFNAAGLKQGYSGLGAAPVSQAAWPGRVLFIKGGDSNYIRDEHRSHILSLFPAAELKIMPGCGHWLHAERPSLFNGIVLRFLQAATA